MDISLYYMGFGVYFRQTYVMLHKNTCAILIKVETKITLINNHDNNAYPNICTQSLDGHGQQTINTRIMHPVKMI